MPTPPKADPEKTCKACGKTLTRKRYGKRLEDRTRFLAREHCNQSCANSRPAVQADTHRLRARQLKPRVACEMCGAKSNLHVHHVNGNPANNSMPNLQVLCASCHLKLHWRQDREKRMEAIRTGARMARRSDAGKQSLAVKRRLLPKSPPGASTVSPPVSRSS